MVFMVYCKYPAFSIIIPVSLETLALAKQEGYFRRLGSIRIQTRIKHNRHVFTITR